MIAPEAIERTQVVQRLSFFYETLNEKLHEAPSCVFHEIVTHSHASVQHEPIVVDSYERFLFTDNQAYLAAWFVNPALQNCA